MNTHFRFYTGLAGDVAIIMQVPDKLVFPFRGDRPIDLRPCRGRNPSAARARTEATYQSIWQV